MSVRLLIADDDDTIRFAVRDYCESLGYTVFEANSLSAAKQVIEADGVTFVVADYQLGDGTALDLLAFIRAFDASIPVIVLTGHATFDLAVRAMREGAENFVPKPVAMEALHLAITKAVAARKKERRLAAMGSRAARTAIDPFLGHSKAVRTLRDGAELALQSEMPVLLLGETGTGKGILASWLHANGPRADAPFVDINAATLSREFFETELFGHEKGAFTGAAGEKKGLLEIANEGTLFLDEIGDVDAAVQPRLLKVLEEHRFRRMGGVRERIVDVRLIAATSQDLAALVQEKRFRSDLYYRISALPLRMPPLRERREDIPLIAQAVVAQLRHGYADIELDPLALERLQDYRWPGNLRELRNTLERALLRVRGPRLSADDLKFDAVLGDAPAATELRTLAEVEADHIRRVFLAENGRVDRAAVRLGISRSSLYTKLKALGLLATR